MIIVITLLLNLISLPFYSPTWIKYKYEQLSSTQFFPRCRCITSPSSKLLWVLSVLLLKSKEFFYGEKESCKKLLGLRGIVYEGGLGVRDLRIFNLFLLLKWVWRWLQGVILFVLKFLSLDMGCWARVKAWGVMKFWSLFGGGILM